MAHGAYGLLLASPAAGADELDLRLDYTAPVECPSASSVRVAVARLVSKPDTEPFQIQVVIEKTHVGYVSRIRSATSAERSLAGATCHEVVEATAVILALALSPKKAAATSPKVADAAVAAPAAKAQTIDMPRADAPRAAPAWSGPRLAFKLGLAGDSSMLARPAFGISGSVALQSESWTVQTAGTYFLPQRTTVPADENRGGSLALWALWPSFCGASTRTWARLEVCAGPELGQIVGKGFGISAPRRAAALWLAMLGAGQLSFGLASNFRAYAALGVAVRLTPDRPFVLDDIATLHQPARASGRAGLGAEVVF